MAYPLSTLRHAHAATLSTLALFTTLALPGHARADGPLHDDATLVIEFGTVLEGAPFDITWDGSHYYAISGTNDQGVKIEKRSDDGTLAGSASPTINGRAIRYHLQSDTVYAVSQDAGVDVPDQGVFSINKDTLLKNKLYNTAFEGPEVGPTFDSAGDLWWVLTPDGSGDVVAYSVMDGALDGPVTTLDLQNPNGEAGSISSIEFDGEYIYTYDAAVVRAYDPNDGSYLGQCAIDTDEQFPLVSYANGLFFVFDNVDMVWQGYSCKKACVDDEDCNDGDLCDGTETCDLVTFECVAGEELDCDDGDVCSADTCDPIGGCINQPLAGCCSSNVACNDGDVCTGVESCDLQSNTCIAGESLDCDDGDVCTEDLCDAVAGCAPVQIEGCCTEDADCQNGATCDADANECVGGTTGDPTDPTGTTDPTGDTETDGTTMGPEPSGSDGSDGSDSADSEGGVVQLDPGSNGCQCRGDGGGGTPLSGLVLVAMGLGLRRRTRR